MTAPRLESISIGLDGSWRSTVWTDQEALEEVMEVIDAGDAVEPLIILLTSAPYVVMAMKADLSSVIASHWP